MVIQLFELGGGDEEVSVTLEHLVNNIKCAYIVLICFLQQQAVQFCIVTQLQCHHR